MPLEQAYQTGTVTSFAGATGLLEALLDFVVGTEVADEVVATAADVSTTLANSPVAKGRLEVVYTISAVEYTATDDGGGVITGTLATGTINYDTGAIAVTFTGTPTGNVTADYIYGEPGQDWKLEFRRDTQDDGGVGAEPFGSDCEECILSSKGISGQEWIGVGFREWEYAAGNAAGWDLNGYTWYNDDMQWNANMTDHGFVLYSGTWERWADMPMLPLVDDTMTYWFFSNRQRIIVVVKISTNYEQCYMGFGRRFGNPSDYNYPLIVGGCLSGTLNYANTSGAHVGLHYNVISDDYNVKMAFGPSGVWWGMSNNESVTCPRIQPRNNWSDSGVIGPSTSGRVMMWPCYVTLNNQNECLMDLDGVWMVTSTGVQAEDTIDHGSIRTLVFPNIFRTTYYDYVAVAMEAITTTTTSTTTTTTS